MNSIYVQKFKKSEMDKLYLKYFKKITKRDMYHLIIALMYHNRIYDFEGFFKDVKNVINEEKKENEK